MASLQCSAFGFICICLLFNTHVIKTDDTNVSSTESPDCPTDSILDPSSNDCVCALFRCPPSPPCEPEHTRSIRVASGVPGDCCDTVDCVSTDPAPTDEKCTGPSCPLISDCPYDSYRLDGVGCQCLPGPGHCQKTICLTGFSARIKRPGTNTPGSCCPEYECAITASNLTCSDNGIEREVGSSWLRADCTKCRCDKGLIFCDAVGTPHSDDTSVCNPLPPECTLRKVPPGQCCPVCLDPLEHLDVTPPQGSCYTSLYGLKLDGATWQEDDCTSCTCKNGQRQCEAYMCEAMCTTPQYEPGECCPRCNGSTVVTVPSHCPPLNNCSLRCVHGFVRDLNGCFTCHCQQDECTLECQHGFAQDIHGNKLCKCSEPKCPPLINCRKNCPHGYRTNKLGCDVCRCETCKPLDHCTKRCAHGLVAKANNCVICKCIPHNSSKDGIFNNTENIGGTPCISDSKVWRDDGETWFDGCRQCYCLAGREMCSLLSCPTAPCANPIYNSSKDCCPSCPGTDLAAASHMVCQGEEPGKVYLEGETWRLSPCVECLCQSGRALCHAASCPPTPCKRPLPAPAGECCSSCPQEQLNNATWSTNCDRRKGETMWSEGNCVSCLCDDGKPLCYTQLCEHQVSCNNALQVKNQCCPICLDQPEARESKVCTVDNMTYTVGDSWQEDECTNCMCIAGGEISCTKLVCSVSCANPVRKPGVCCHICPDTKSFSSGREIVYIIVLSVVACAALILSFYVARQCKLKRHQLKLHNYGCPPPQYTQYRYMPTYDSPQTHTNNTEKTALTPL